MIAVEPLESTALGLTQEQISVLNSVLRAKERRLFELIRSRPGPMTIGAMCAALHTTVWTLFRKTWPGLKAKVAAVIAATEGIGA
jgi:hypothetical protein